MWISRSAPYREYIPTKRREVHKSSNVALGELRSHHYKRKMAEFMKCRQIIATPFSNRSFQPRPKVAVRKCNLVPLTRPNRAKLSQPRKINIRPLSEATQQNWLTNLKKAKDATSATTSLAPTPSQPTLIHHPHCLLLHVYLL